LLARQAHLCNGILNNDAELRMGINLKRHRTHDTHFLNREMGALNAGAIVLQRARHINQTSRNLLSGFNVYRVS
jgi:hypothetical protein